MTPRRDSRTAPARATAARGDTARGRTAGPAPRAVLRLYEDAARRSRATGRSVTVSFVVEPSGAAVLAPAHPRPREEPGRPQPPRRATDDAHPAAPKPEPELQTALAAARERGRRRAAEILAGEDMLSAAQFAALIGTSRVTVNAKRQRRELLALDGAKRGFRFPAWQLDADGKPYAALPALFDRLGGGAWAVYRFLLQPHPELDGLTGREALARGLSARAVEAAEGVGRDFG